MTSKLDSSSPRRSVRGAVRVSVSTSRDAIIAGDLFSVFVKVQNPFEVPLGLVDISAFVPVEFYDVDERRRATVASLGTVVGHAGRVANIVSTFVGLKQRESITASPNTLGHVSARSIAGSGESNEMTVLQPGNSTTRVFTLCSRMERRFRPGTYRMQICVRYRFDTDDEDTTPDEDNADVIEYTLDVRSSQSSILLGGVIGATLGWLAGNLTKLHGQGFYLAAGGWLVHVLIAVGILLMFSRKKDVQPLLSIEDIYGGALTGFLVGFSGGEAVESMLKFPMTGSGEG